MRELAGAVLVVLLGLLLALLWVDSWPDAPFEPTDLSIPRLVNFPKFVMCGTSWELRRNCGVRGVQEVTRVDFDLAVAKQGKEVAAAGRRPLLLCIGSKDFDGDWGDYVEVLRNSTGVDYQLVLVEPDPQWHPRIPEAFERWARAHPEHHIPWRKSVLVKAAVSAYCADETVTFFKLAQAALDLLHADDPALAQRAQDTFGASSIDQDWIINDLRNSLLRKYKVKDFHQYVQSVSVRCLTPVQLLREVGASLSDLVMLTVDAEGEDRTIIKNLLDLGARPAHIFFETNIVRQPNKWVVPVVQSAGYEVGIHCDFTCPRGGSANLVAVHEDYVRSGVTPLA